MNEDIDAPTGSESLTIDQAAAAYVKATATKEVQTDQPKADEEDESDTPTDDIEQASDEDVSEEGDGETGDTDETGDEEGNEEDESGKGRFAADNARTKLGDEFLTVAELKAGYLKNADATKKWQEASDIRKTSEARSAALQASEEQLTREREYAISLVKAVLPPRPDPAMADPRSDKYDPAKYQADDVAFREWASYLTQLETDQQRAAETRQADADAKSKEKLATEWATALEKLPELKDSKKLESFGKDTLKYGALAGYTPQELANIHADHRNLVVMKGYIQWEKLQASKANVQKKVEGRPPVQRGGKRLSPNDARARSASDAFNRLKQSGSVEDAAAAYIASHPRKG